MAYYRGKDIEKSRGNAMQEVILEKRSVAQVARRFGKNRSTIYRWIKKWRMQQNVYCWKIPVDHLDPSEKPFVGNM